MYENTYANICAQVNSAFEIRGLVDYIAWYPEKLKREGDVYITLCPIHRDTVFRTLVLNPRINTYQCRHLACPGHSPADFLDLLTKVQNVSLPEVLENVVSHFGRDYFRITEAQMKVIGELVAQVRAG